MNHQAPEQGNHKLTDAGATRRQHTTAMNRGMKYASLSQLWETAQSAFLALAFREESRQPAPPTTSLLHRKHGLPCGRKSCRARTSLARHGSRKYRLMPLHHSDQERCPLTAAGGGGAEAALQLVLLLEALHEGLELGLGGLVLLLLLGDGGVELVGGHGRELLDRRAESANTS